MTYVTIDFSLNSPGICIFHNKKYTFLSYIKPKSGTKKELAIQEKMAELTDVIYTLQPDFKNNLSYSSAELAKINRYITTSNAIIEMILSITQGSTDYIFAFEGTSFGSKMGTNNIIDMAAGAAILKMKIIETFNPIDILTVAPSTIKKHMDRGNMNKVELWNMFLMDKLKDTELTKSKFLQFCKTEIGETKKIPKPFDDLVDAYVLNHYIRSLTVD